MGRLTCVCFLTVLERRYPKVVQDLHDAMRRFARVLGPLEHDKFIESHACEQCLVGFLLKILRLDYPASQMTCWHSKKGQMVAYRFNSNAVFNDFNKKHFHNRHKASLRYYINSEYFIFIHKCVPDLMSKSVAMMVKKKKWMDAWIPGFSISQVCKRTMPDAKSLQRVGFIYQAGY